MLGRKPLTDLNIPVGTRFRADAGTVWEFAGLVPTKDRVLHVRLVRPDDPYTAKIISADALMNRQMFNPID